VLFLAIKTKEIEKYFELKMFIIKDSDVKARALVSELETCYNIILHKFL